MSYGEELVERLTERRRFLERVVETEVSDALSGPWTEALGEPLRRGADCIRLEVRLDPSLSGYPNVEGRFLDLLLRGMGSALSAEGLVIDQGQAALVIRVLAALEPLQPITSEVLVKPVRLLKCLQEGK